MTNEEAIKILKDMIPKTYKMVNGRYVGGFEDTECPRFEAVQVAVEALEKQIPKKVEVTKYDIGGNDYFCHCGNKLQNGAEYCDMCGCKLDWSGTK